MFRCSINNLFAAAACLALCAGCLVQRMADQPRVGTLQESDFYPDGQGSRPQVPGTVARGQIWERTPVTTGRKDGRLVRRIPIDVDAKLLSRGRKLFGIFCSHCHGHAGYGDGMVVQRGFSHPPSYHIERLQNAPDGHFFRVITDGYRHMPTFRARIKPRDRWAIIAYIRALQLSQNAAPQELQEQDREQLKATKSK